LTKYERVYSLKYVQISPRMNWECPILYLYNLAFAPGLINGS